MKPSVLALPALAAGLVLIAGPGRADARLVSLAPPPTMAQALTPPHARVPVPRVLRRPGLTLPRVPPPNPFGNVMPHSYLIFGLKSGPNGMACTDRNGAALSMPFNPQVIMGPQVAPPMFTLPRLPALPAPKKLPRK